MPRWEPSALLSDHWPCPPEDAAIVMTTLSHVPYLESWRYDATLQRVVWTLKNNDARDCAHLAVKRQVAKAIALHAVVRWS